MPQEQVGDMVARSPGVVLPPEKGSASGAPTAEEFEKILTFGDDRIDRDPSDYYAFRMIVSSDGIDSFYTRPDAKTSLVNYTADLKRGQSLLGSHLTGTFSYGVSYDGELMSADPERHEYEASFFRRLSNKFASASPKDTAAPTQTWAIGKYAIPRGMTVNAQNTDDLIRGIQMGAIRRVSISFTVGRYVCDIDGKDMIAGFFGPEGSGDCRHMPGVDYGDKGGVATALMVDNDLHETSLVFKNSSPSAMFLRKAETMAQRGMITDSDIVKLEERMSYRLPRYERSVHPVTVLTPLSYTLTTTGSTTMTTGSTKEEKMTERHPGHFHVGLNVDAEDIKGGHGTEYEDVPGDEGDDPESAAEMLAPGILEQMADEQPEDKPDPDAEDDMAETPADKLANLKKKASPDSVSSAHPGHYHDSETKGGHFTKEPAPFEAAASEEAEAIDVYAPRSKDEEGDRMVQARAMARDVLGRIAAYETRDTSIAEELGEPVSVEAVKRLSRDAKLGRELFAAEVDAAVRARIAVDGDGFNAEKWRALLASSRDVELVQSEKDLWNKRKGELFTSGRQIKPTPLPEKKTSTRSDPGGNIIASLPKL